MSDQHIVFYDPDFPIAEGMVIPSSQLDKLCHVTDADELSEALRHADNGCFVNLHAPYFPKQAWKDIVDFLERGGGLISIGGAPFKCPVRKVDGEWKAEEEQTAYHRQLRIHETLSVSRSPIHSLSARNEIPLLVGMEDCFTIEDTWNLVPHVTKASDLPHEMGSAGPMDTRIYPLLTGTSSTGREVAAPVVLWEHHGGSFRGSRWMLVNQTVNRNFWECGGAAYLLHWAQFCAKGVTEMWLKPNYASYEPGERAVLTLQAQFLGCAAPPKMWSFSMTVTKDDKVEPDWSYKAEMEVTKDIRFLRIPVEVNIDPGLYHVVCKAQSEDGETRVLRQGFWGFDGALLAEGEPITSDRDYFIKDGTPLPVVGMTYMTSDVARKYLFLPNPDVWDKDMSQMKQAGINWIRTGLWTAYRHVMQVDGHVSEEVLRAIDAFLLTSKKHGLQTTFTFFSFTPELWEGVNPYLDPRSVEAQKRFIRSIVSRHQHSTHVDWDLINEPSMFDPKMIFSDGPRSCHDRFEQDAFVDWLKKRHGSIEVLQERWNMTPDQLPDFAAAKIPEAEEINFDVQDMHQGKNGTRWLDYTLFSMDMLNRWAKELVEVIKEACPDHLVTVGQDEALGAQRPSPYFYAEAVDYTTVHSWWLNDQLVWDGIFAKTSNKPNLVQETGIMYVETPEGKAKRTEEELRNILERKYAYAFSTGGAGAIQWIWNTNFYMDNANESHIGALRADGTEKPEANVSVDFGQFMSSIRDLFQARKLEEVAVVFPYSNDFSNRKLAFDATTKATRVLSYELKLPFRGVSEYHLEALEQDPAKLIIWPGAHNIDQDAFERLITIVKKTGATLLVSGALGIDAYWRKTNRLEDVVGKRHLGNVLREECMLLQGRCYPVSYGQRRIAEVSKESLVSESGASAVLEYPLGQGRLIWCPLPVELNERIEPISALYQYAIASANVSDELEWLSSGELPGVYGRKIRFKKGALFVFVSEYAANTEVCVKDRVTGVQYSFKLDKERSVLFATDASGMLRAVYRPNEVTVKVSCD